MIDVGSGFGGPARQIAEQTAATVVGIDITLAYVDAAETHNSRMSFGDSVRFQYADIMDLCAEHMMAGWHDGAPANAHERPC